VPIKRSILALTAVTALVSGCVKNGDFDETGGIILTRHYAVQSCLKPGCQRD
jgi:hypothetical protein